MPYSDLKYVNSHVLRAVAYDHTNCDLILVFRSGSAYLYDGVPHQVYFDLITASSIGSHFYSAFRPSFTGRPLSILEVHRLITPGAAVVVGHEQLVSMSASLPVMEFLQ